MTDRMIYLDNAATSFPKAPGVAEAMAEQIEHGAGGPGRTFGAAGAAAAQVLFETRQRLAELLNWWDSADIILTPGATYSLNLALNGLVRPGQHLITTALEHNAVARPISHLRELGVNVTRLECPQGLGPDPEDFRRTLQPDTALIAMVHASNVTGAILPLAEVAAIAREAEVPLLVDASQTVGALPIDIAQDQPSLLAFAGHKGLLGPPGTGGIYIAPHIAVEPLWRGGTGSHGASVEQPVERPDRFESGTPNVPGIAGLGVAVQFVLERGVENIRRHEMRLVEMLLAELRQIPDLTIYGPAGAGERLGVVSFNIGELDPAEVGMRLEQDYGIISRCGFHCAAWAHESIGTLDRGTVRFSVSPFTREDEVSAAIRAVGEIAAS